MVRLDLTVVEVESNVGALVQTKECETGIGWNSTLHRLQLTENVSILEDNNLIKPMGKRRSFIDDGFEPVGYVLHLLAPDIVAPELRDDKISCWGDEKTNSGAR